MLLQLHWCCDMHPRRVGDFKYVWCGAGDVVVVMMPDGYDGDAYDVEICL